MRQLPRLLLVYLALVCASLARGGEPLDVGDAAPDWILADSQDEFITFYKDSEDKAAVILFWATWCQYCVELMPRLDALKAELKTQDIQFYAINIWEDADPIAYMAKENFDFTLLLQGDMVAKRYGVNGTPGLMVIGPDKTIRYVRAAGTNPDQACAEVKQTLQSF